MADRASQLTRFRPAVLVVAGIAAVIGTYVVYNTFHDSAPPKSALHRSNAIHRSRISHWGRAQVSTQPATLEAPLGVIRITTAHSTSRTLSLALGIDDMPSADDLTATFGQGADYLLPAINSTALDRVFKSLHSILPTARFRQVVRMGLDSLAVAVSLESRAEIMACSDQIRNIIPGVSDNDIELAIDRILDHGPHGEPPPAQHVDEETEFANTEFGDIDTMGPSQGLKGLLYHIAEDNARRKAYEHRGIQCDECGECPIRGIRWRCLNCPDVDLCSTCEADTLHDKTHVFVKLRTPMPVLCQPDMVQIPWYPGDTSVTAVQLATTTRQHLCVMYDLEETQVDAWYDQFRCTADAAFENDDNKVNGAISRRAFNVTMTSPRFRTRYMPNLLYNRMFAFYDSNGDGLISFEEFVEGMSYLRGPRRFDSLRKALQGFDLDGNGLVDREDFVRLLQAKYDVQRLLFFDFTASHEFRETEAATDTILSGQTISAAFNVEEIPQGVFRQPNGKSPDAHGDLRPFAQTQTILDDDAPWPAHNETRQNGRAMEPRERLRNTLSRFEELLYGPDVEESGAVPTIEDHISLSSDAAVESDESLQPSTLAADHDALWYLVREGIYHLLDSLFKAKEDGARDVEMTVAERGRWHREIAAFETRERERLRAMNADTNEDDTNEPTATALPTQIKVDLLPTDEETLVRLEEEIKFATLEDLLSASGYGHLDEDPSMLDSSRRILSGEVSPRNGDEMPSTVQRRHEHSFQERLRDGSSGSSPDKQAMSEKGPSESRLTLLAVTQRLADEIEERGGPGRLTFDEIEQMVDVDVTRELRGLVVGWLELASF